MFVALLNEGQVINEISITESNKINEHAAVKAAKKIALNTGIIYTKLIVKLAAGLIITRLVLGALGQVDYGIYSVVAGVIGLLSFLNAAMSSASMRFISHNLGTGDSHLIRSTFNSTLVIHFILGFIVVVIMEIGGSLMFEYLLKIPSDRLYDAKIIFHLMTASTFVTIISVPFDAVINAHENFLALSTIEIIGVVIHLVIAVLLTYLIEANLLVVYSVLVLMMQITLRFIKQRYSINKYKECKIRVFEYTDKKVIKKILSFSGWNLFGVVGGILTVQSTSIFLNMFFGVLLNTANGIATSFASQLNNFSESMTQAINPQIMKSEGGGKRDRMLKLTATSAKFSVFLFAFFSLPTIIETPYLLKLWLKNVPDYSIIFCRLLLVSIFLEKYTFQLSIALKAVGKLRGITITGTILLISRIYVAYMLFKMNYPPYSIYLVNILFSISTAISRLYFGKKVAGLSIKEYLEAVIFRGSLPLFFASIFSPIPSLLMNEGILRLLLTVSISSITILIFVSYMGLTSNERQRIKGILPESLAKLKLTFPTILFK